MTSSASLRAAVLAASISLAACGGSADNADLDTGSTSESEQVSDVNDPAESEIRVVSPADAAATIEGAPEGLVILDVRTPEEFGEGHIADAALLDFYRDDFADELAKLDRDVPYVLYCRSGNRSGQARAMMETLGFESVDDVDGGILNWQAEGLPTVAD